MARPKPEGYTPPLDPAKQLVAWRNRNATVEATVVRLTEEEGQPVWEVRFPQLPGARGVVPFQEMGLPEARMARYFVGHRVNVKVKTVDRPLGAAVCSRREVVEEAARELFKSLAEGQVIDCVVKAVLPRRKDKPSRLLLDVGGGVLAEVPQNMAVWNRERLEELFRPGQVVKAKVLKVDPTSRAVEVSVRDALPDPWEGFTCKPGDELPCRVVYVTGSLVFVEVEGFPGVQGLAPRPLLGEVRPGDRVKCAVASFKPESKKLRLRLKGFTA